MNNESVQNKLTNQSDLYPSFIYCMCSRAQFVTNGDQDCSGHCILLFIIYYNDTFR